MKIFLYIIRGISSGKKYVGITNNLERRLKEHRSGQTKGGQVIGDFQLLHTEEFIDYETAREMEIFLKSGQGRQWINKTILKHGPPEEGKASSASSGLVRLWRIRLRQRRTSPACPPMEDWDHQ